MSDSAHQKSPPVSNTSSTLKVLFFAAARQRTQKSHINHPFSAPLTLGQLKHSLFESYPDLGDLGPYLRWAVNHEFVDDDTRELKANDEVALIPPISGG